MVIEVNGIELHWQEAGDGQPLLWLHGAMGCGADWRHMFSEPPDGFRIIAPDLRGHGSSTDPSGQFTFRQCARDLQALLSHLALPRVKALGVSGGGIVLLHMATARPASIESMIIVSAPPCFPERCRVAQRQFSESTIGADELERMRGRHPRGDLQIRQLFDIVHGFAETYDDVNFTQPYLATISAETLVVFGDRDPLYDVSLAFELYRSIPRSYLWVVPNGRHAPVFGEELEPFLDKALPFLRGAWRADPGRGTERPNGAG